MKILPILLFLMIVCSSFGQTGKLELSFSDENRLTRSSDSLYYSLHIWNRDTSIVQPLLVEWESSETVIDSLTPGSYRLMINLPLMDSILIYQRDFSIHAKEITYLNISLDTYEHYTPLSDLTREEKITHRIESQIEGGYFNNRLTETNPALTHSFSASYSGHYWVGFSKHVGVFLGCGLGLNHSSISKDTTFFNASQFEKRYEYYNYLYLNPEFKLRFTLKNQRDDYDFLVNGLILDIGARYHFPLMFKHVGRFAGNTKIVESGLHQYSDLRFFANIGHAPVLFFAEYRPFDFVLGNYPELPKYTIGLKIVFHY